MPYPYPLNVETLLGIEEVTYATDPTPTPATDAIRHIKHLWTDLESQYAFPNLRDDVVTNTLIEALPATPRGRFVDFEIEVEVKGAGVAYSGVPTIVRPEIDPLLMASGLARVHDDTGAAETVTYSLADSGHSSATLYVYAGGKRAIVVGCRMNPVWSPRAGELGRMRFRVMGLLTSIVESDPAPAGTYDATESPAVVSMGLSIDPTVGAAWVPNWTEGELDLGNEIVRLDDGNASDAIEGFFIPARKPRFRLTARTEDLADYDPEALFASVDVHSVDLSLGATQYNSMDVAVVDGTLTGPPGRVEDNQFAGWTLEYRLRDLAIVFD